MGRGLGGVSSWGCVRRWPLSRDLNHVRNRPCRSLGRRERLCKGPETGLTWRTWRAARRPACLSTFEREHRGGAVSESGGGWTKREACFIPGVVENGSVEDQCLLLVVLSQQQLHPHHCNGLGGRRCLQVRRGKPGRLPRVSAPSCSHLQRVLVLSFWPRGRRRRQAGDRQGSTHLFRSWANSASERKLVKEGKKR